MCLILFSGLPGCGKTTLARLLVKELHCAYFAKDRIQRVLNAHIEGAQPIDGYRVMLDLAGEHLQLGTTVVLDAVFPMEGFREEARRLAIAAQTPFLPVYCFYSDEALWRQRMQNRVQYVPGWEPVGWDEVEQIRERFEEWHVSPLLQLDAVDSVGENFTKVRAYLTSMCIGS
ncbi:MAG: AAA family ATPase [Chloroflexi bacterium]|nr:AAA family ATPase [Chloroflexota bacterium]